MPESVSARAKPIDELTKGAAALFRAQASAAERFRELASKSRETVERSRELLQRANREPS
jgi:hypothetical protein